MKLHPLSTVEGLEYLGTFYRLNTRTWEYLILDTKQLVIVSYYKDKSGRSNRFLVSIDTSKWFFFQRFRKNYQRYLDSIIKALDIKNYTEFWVFKHLYIREVE